LVVLASGQGDPGDAFTRGEGQLGLGSAAAAVGQDSAVGERQTDAVQACTATQPHRPYGGVAGDPVDVGECGAVRTAVLVTHPDLVVEGPVEADQVRVVVRQRLAGAVEELQVLVVVLGCGQVDEPVADLRMEDSPVLALPEKPVS
jgi:hypothetical protein